MANGTPISTYAYYQGNAGTTISQHANRWTATFPAGSSVAYLNVGQLAADDLVIVEQRGQQAGLQIKHSASLDTHDSNAGAVTFTTEDNNNASTAIPFAFSILRNS